ncbi:MAG: M48 family metallopeptidase [Tannerellaceae bacterium]|jgi:predicted Zn-dependent protease|nr:M48 family metallopeptidase [Tannerellaceae bacterium]
MKKLVYVIAVLALLGSGGCGNVPLTGRKQILLVSDQEVLSASLTQYGDFMKGAELSADKKGTEKVVRVGKKIAAATEAYLKANGLEAEIATFAWEFHLVKSPEINAFCMPGGKIVVYEGIMPYASTDDELAAVIGHEVAHAVAKHSNERMSQQMLASYGGAVLDQAVSKKSATVQAIAGTVYGLGAQYGVMLPYSRKHELEADHMGLVFMAMGGYNPQSAISFWTKMSQGKESSVPEIMSTHPADSHRIEEIKKYLPEAVKFYRK